MINSGFLNIVSNAFKNIRKNSLMSLASISILSACLVILGSSFLIADNLSQFVTGLESMNEIAIFLDEDLTDEQDEALGEQIKDIENVASIEFISGEEALEKLMDEKLKGTPAAIIKGLEENNPIRDTFIVKIKDINKYESTLEKISKLSGVANVRGKQNIVVKLLNVKSTLTMLTVWILAILAAVSLFIISNTVRLAMFTRKLEINIMKFVGATDNFIRMPFLIEGIIIGLIACTIAFFAQWYIYSGIIVPLLNELSLFEPVIFESLGKQLFISFLVFSVIIGALGSILPMRKYLKV